MTPAATTTGSPRIRRCLPTDEAALYRVCLQTGDAGRDATTLHDDPLALGHIYVGPYLHFEPEFASALEDSEGVCGYVFGALNSGQFYQSYLNKWLPEISCRHPQPTGDPARWSPTQLIYHEYHHPDIYYPDSFRDYPSHMHIDLLSRVQGQGWGRRMVDGLLNELRAAGSTGVHLAMNGSNARAERFYRKLGFNELARTGKAEPQTVYFGRRLDPVPGS